MVPETYEKRKRILGSNIRRFLKENNLTELQFAAQSGIKKTTLNSWICGSSYPGQENLVRLAAALHCEIAELTEEEYYMDDRRRFLTIRQAALLSAYNSSRTFQLICDHLIKLQRETRLEAYAIEITRMLEEYSSDIDSGREETDSDSLSPE